jgi:hypothetical protein
MHFAHIAALTMYLISMIYFADMLPQQDVYRNELNCECYNFRKEKQGSLMKI